MSSHDNYALIIVDVQYDFLPGGPLGVQDADTILHPINLLTRDASLIVASRDWHPDNHFSFSDDPQYVDGSWPPHCIQGTKGAKLYPSVRKVANFVVSKGMNRNPPDAYSAFAGKTLRPVNTLEEILGRSAIETVVVTGLVFDKCVGFTALDAAALGYLTVVPMNATAALSPEGMTDMLNKLETAGVYTPDEYFTRTLPIQAR